MNDDLKYNKFIYIYLPLSHSVSLSYSKSHLDLNGKKNPFGSIFSQQNSTKLES
jgi:hypothetical protein